MTETAGAAAGTAEKARQETEIVRETTRRRIAFALIGTLLIVVVGTLLLVVGLSLFGDLTTDALMAVTQTVGTTLLVPLVGLVGAVIGFYYGGQAAVQGAQTADQTTRNATDAATRLASQITTDQTQQQTDLTQPRPVQPSYSQAWPREPVGQ